CPLSSCGKVCRPNESSNPSRRLACCKHEIARLPQGLPETAPFGRLIRDLVPGLGERRNQLFLAMFGVASRWVMQQGNSHAILDRLSGQTKSSARFISVTMRILISNDDGIYSPGIIALAKVASRFGQVRIVAPDVEQSSMSHAITSSRPLRYKRIRLGDFEAYSVNGTPADCVALGTHHWQHVELALSGINLGLNLGNSCWHSGTLAAAKQAALLGVRGIAFSAAVSENKDPDFAKLDPYVAKVID